MTTTTHYEPCQSDMKTSDSGGVRDVMLNRNLLLENSIFGLELMDERAQPFVLLRSQLLSRLAGMGGRIVAVTSTQPENGKSFVSANLATALCQIRPTQLVDLDLRRPTVRQRFGLPDCPGVDDYLQGDGPLAGFGSRVAGHTLGLLPVRRALENSADLLASTRGESLFAELRALPGSPVCIIDTPPVLEADDMLIIGRHVDGVLLVVEEGRTRGDDLLEAVRMLHPTPVIGTILNRSVARTVSSTYYGYSGYRRYIGPMIHEAK